MRRPLRFLLYVLAGIGIGVLLAVIAIQLLTRTEFGQERIRRFAVGWLDDRVDGTVRVGRISGRGLLGGVTVHDFEITDPLGRPFIEADSASISYEWKTLLRGDIVFDEVALYSPTITIEKLPGDSLWNYERVFPDTTPGEDRGSHRLILLNDVRLQNGTVLLRRPWEPEGHVQVSDTARLVLEAVPGGTAQVWRFDRLDARLDEVLWQSPIEDGRMFKLDALSGRAFLWEDPVHIEDVKGTVTQVDSVLSFELPVVKLPASTASVVGQVVLGSEGNRYDVQVDGDRFAFADLQWLYPRLPADGGGTMTLRVQTQPHGTLWLVRDARIASAGTQLAGTFGVVTGDTLYFTAVDLRASPLDVKLLESLLPGGLPVQGLLVGTVEVKGPLSALETHGDLRYAASGTEPSTVRWRGVVDARGVPGARDLTADVRNLDMGVLAAFLPGLPARGRLSGSIEADGRLDRDLSVRGALRHELDGAVAELRGGGTLRDSAGRRSLSLRLDSSRVSLEDVAALYPALAGLSGEARGSLTLRGPLENLTVDADLVTDAGPVMFSGRLDRRNGQPRYSGDGSVAGFRLDRLAGSLPGAAVSGSFAFDLTGAGLATMTGSMSLDVDSAIVAGVPIDAARVVAHVANGVASVDTLVASAVGAALHGHGSLGLVAGRSGAFSIVAASASLEPLENIAFDEVLDPTHPRIAGDGRLTADLVGSLSAFDLHASGWLRGLRIDDDRLASGTLRVDGHALGGPSATLDGALLLDTLVALDHRLDSAVVTLAYDSGIARIRAHGAENGREALRLAIDASATDGTRTLLLNDLSAGIGSDAWVLRDTARVTWTPTGLVVDDVRLTRADGGGDLHAAGRLAWFGAPDLDPAATARPLDFSVELRAVPVADLLRVAGWNPAAGGAVDGTVRIGGTARSPRLDASLDLGGLSYEDIGVDRIFAHFDYADLALQTHIEAEQGGRRVLTGDGHVPLDLRFLSLPDRRLAQPVTVSLEADSLPLALLLGTLDSFSDVRGIVDGSLEATGTTRAPALSGDLALRRGSATWDAIGVRYRDAGGSVVLRDGKAAVDLVTSSTDAQGADAGGGSAQITGTLDFDELTDPGFDVTVRADHLLAAGRRDVELTASGQVGIGGHYRRPIVNGNLTIDGGTLYLDELFRRYQVVGLESPLLFAVVDTSLVAVRRVLPSTENPFLKNLKVEEARITVGPESWLRSREMNVEVAGNLTVAFDRSARDQDLRLTGTLDAVRGTYRFDYPGFARVFDVRTGTVEFPGTPGIDPNLDITAVYKARSQNGPLDILARLTGTLQAPRVRLTSDAQPPISESDLASYLFFGAPTYAFSNGGGAAGGTEGEGSGFGRLGLQAATASVFGYIASGLQTVAQDFGLVDYVGITAAETMPGTPQENGLLSRLANTQIELGRYISPSIFVAATQRLESTAYTPGIHIDWRFHPTYSAEIFWEDRFARAPAPELLQGLDPRKVLGFFLFREWGY